MLSRVANSVYWMNRYIERAENVARFIDVDVRLFEHRIGVVGGSRPTNAVSLLGARRCCGATRQQEGRQGESDGGAGQNLSCCHLLLL